MVLTVGALAREVGLTVRVDAGLDRAVAWVHSTELADPTPFLEGGELLLTTGIALGRHDEYVRRLVAAGAVGLGFGTGLSHDRVPEGLVRAARDAGLALLEVPRATPFIAITKAVSRAVAADEYAALARTGAAQRALTRAAVGDGPPGVVRRLARLIDGAAALLDPHGAPVHVVGSLPDLAGHVRRLAAAGGPAGAAWQAGDRHVAMQVLGRRGYLAVAAGSPLDAGVVNTAASLLTVALARSDEVDAVRRELREARFRLALAGVPVDGVPEGRFRVFVLREAAEPVGFWAEVDGRVVVLAREVDVPAAASSPVDAGSVARRLPGGVAGAGGRRGRVRGRRRVRSARAGRGGVRRHPARAAGRRAARDGAGVAGVPRSGRSGRRAARRAPAHRAQPAQAGGAVARAFAGTRRRARRALARAARVTVR